MQLFPSSDFDDDHIRDFLAAQSRDHGGKIEIDENLWALFAVPSTDSLAGALARSLLSVAPFAHDSGVSADEAWTLYYVDTANRPAAIDWLGALPALLAGEIRPVSMAQRALIHEVRDSAAPHRAAQRLGELHDRGEISAGLVREPAVVRALLDRLHQREPLFFSALLVLLNHHLVDLVVLLRQLIPEDVELKNEILQGGISRDPFLQSRQSAAAEIRNHFIRFRLINPLDQQKNTAITNPYAVFMEILVSGDHVLLPIDGVTVPVPREHYVRAIHSIRRGLYRGGEISQFDPHSLWVTREIAHPFRFLKQRIETRRDLTVMDALCLLERAV